MLFIHLLKRYLSYTSYVLVLSRVFIQVKSTKLNFISCSETGTDHINIHFTCHYRFILIMGNKASCCLNLRSKIHAEEMDVNSVGKAKTCQFFSISRPYMRVFHSSWFCLFIANTSLFSLQPMLPVLHRDLNLTEVQLANSGIVLVASSICVRLEAGPLCDIFGSRKVMSLLLIFGSIAPALVGLVEDGTGLIIISFFIGFLEERLCQVNYGIQACFVKIS